MALSMHAGYNKNENPLENEKFGDQSKVLVGNWTEERALLEVREICSVESWIGLM
jgi:hypothetical protein